MSQVRCGYRNGKETKEHRFNDNGFEFVRKTKRNRVGNLRFQTTNAGSEHGVARLENLSPLWYRLRAGFLCKGKNGVLESVAKKLKMVVVFRNSNSNLPCWTKLSTTACCSQQRLELQTCRLCWWPRPSYRHSAHTTHSVSPVQSFDAFSFLKPKRPTYERVAPMDLRRVALVVAGSSLVEGSDFRLLAAVGLSVAL